MTRMRWTGAAMLTAMVLLMLSGCVELTSQRLSWRYDAKADRIDALLFYDGIHHRGSRISTSDEPSNAAADQAAVDLAADTRQLAESIKNGDIMLYNWLFGVYQPAELQAALQADEDLIPEQKQLIEQALGSIRTHFIGHYHDAQGRIGAVQSITITNASKLVAAMNNCINATYRKAPKPDPASATYATDLLMRQAAQRNHTWFSLDRNSIVCTLPVDRHELAKMKAAFLNDPQWPGTVAQLVASVPISFTEQPAQVTIRIGDPDGPDTLRDSFDPGYTDNLAETVKQHIPADLDAELAKYLLDDKHTPNTDLDAIIAFGPPEQQAAALLDVAFSDDATGANALTKLKSWAAQWNAGHSYPQAPTQAATDAPDPEAAYLQSWDIWRKQMAAYPGEVPQP